MKARFFLVLFTIVVLMVLPELSSAQTVAMMQNSGNNNLFREHGLYFTPQVAITSYAFNFGASMEYGLTENIGVGGTVMLAFWSDNALRLSQTLITPSAEGYYHFTKLDVENLDLFAGAALGFSIYSFSWDFGNGDDNAVGAGGVFLSPILGGRYFFSEKIAACLKLYVSIIGNFAGVGAVAGVTIVLK